MTYQFKAKSCISVSAQDAGELCASLAQTGGLTPKRLLDASRDPSAPLYSAFEWDDTLAAEKYREGQARHIIANIVAVNEGTEEKLVRAFIHIEEDDSRSYQPLPVVMQTPSMYAQMLANAKRELASFQNKYNTLTELTEVFQAINHLR